MGGAPTQGPPVFNHMIQSTYLFRVKRLHLWFMEYSVKVSWLLLFLWMAKIRL